MFMIKYKKTFFRKQGHSEELWAIASYPNNEPIFVTAGYDQYVCQWNATRHSVVWKAQVEVSCI